MSEVLLTFYTCDDCDESVPYGVEHVCDQGEAACAIGAHRWIDLTAFGDDMQNLFCGRWGCGAWARLPWPVLS